LRDSIGEIVEPGKEFDATDVRIATHDRRLIFIMNIGRRSVLATEQGGIVYNDPIFVIDVSADGRNAALVATRVTFPLIVCSTARSLIQK
jgi:hypothetical protein